MTKLSIALLLLLSACPIEPSLSPREGCEQGVATLCERLYACFTEAELAAAGYPSSEAACITRYEEARGCAAQTLDNTCDGNEHFDGVEARQCVDEIGGLECSQLRDRNLDLAAAAPACGRVCSVE